MAYPLAHTRPPWLFFAACLLILLAGCAGDVTPTPERLDRTRVGQVNSPTSTQTATASQTPTATLSPTPTQTPSPTPTPTATAPPSLLRGDPRAYAAQPPQPLPNAICGVVDFFDFPVDPPNALAVARGGTDYNLFRERYNGFHAGEDWRGPNGRDLGSPVYSIGHGRVAYAQPNGWGTDQGVLIVRHVLADGSHILSFYGHLDPPSVILRTGDCVARGDKVGEIGDPRGRPHLHFEIRIHMPNEPGPGYWSEDPTRAGWYPPSLTIWANRLAVSPGVLWARSPGYENPFAAKQAVGFLPGDVLVLLEQGQLTGIDTGSGGVVWSQPPPPTPTPQPGATPDPTRIAREMVAAAPGSAALDDAAPVIYTSDSRGRVQALAAVGEGPNDGSFNSGGLNFAQPLWQLDLELRGSPAVYALPGGGVAVVGRSEVVALDSSGAELWRQPLDDWPNPALRVGDRLFLPVGRGLPTLWELAATGATPWPDLPAGTPVGGSGSFMWLYAREGIYRLDADRRTAQSVMLLPRAVYVSVVRGGAAAVALPDEGLLVAHHDLYDRRLLRFDAQGRLVWERSYEDAAEGQPQLVLLDGQPYLALAEEGATMMVNVYSVDLETGDLVQIFASGTREGNFQETWLLAGPQGKLLVNIGGGYLVALDPLQAQQALAP